VSKKLSRKRFLQRPEAQEEFARCLKLGTFLPQKPVCVTPVEEKLSAEARPLIFRQDNKQPGWTKGVGQRADCRLDPEHSTLETIRSPASGILVGYDDHHDHVGLRSDAIFKLLTDRRAEDSESASPPTLS